jgi:RNA polymerase sigma-70 factor (ECF subfamily)
MTDWPESGPDSPQRLSQISTVWTVLLQAQRGTEDAVSAGQLQCLERYGGAIHRYLLGALRDVHAADDLFQEFALRFVRGDFKRADPQCGRFRNFLKTSLYHLVVDYQRRQKKRRLSLQPGAVQPASDKSQALDSDREFLTVWRAKLMHCAWQALAAEERRSGNHLYTVLRYRTDHPEIRAPQMARELAPAQGKPVTSGWIRKRLFLAREKFTDLLLDEVVGSLDRPGHAEIEQALLDLGLLKYCRSALLRRRPCPLSKSRRSAYPFLRMREPRSRHSATFSHPTRSSSI